MSDILQYCRPEEVGIHPSWIEEYVNTVNENRKMSHSFVMLRGGKVFAEGYWKPFHKDWKHRMYSASKSFVSAAIGMLADEGKIRLDDKIIDYFPDMIPEGGAHPWVAATTIRHMLMMATCNNGTVYIPEENHWLDAFFNPTRTPAAEPGTRFFYDTSATYTLCVLVERITGMPFLEYLKDKALRELGFSEDAWCIEAPDGYSWGGSGVVCTNRDLARFAMLFANGGNVAGRQYISREYVEAATSKQIENSNIFEEKDVCKGHGYGYQIWRIRDGYAFMGMGCQLALFVPKKDLIFTCNSFTLVEPDLHDLYYRVAEYFFDKIADRVDADTDSIPMDDGAYRRLEAVLSGLELSTPEGEISSPMAEKVNGKEYILGENRMGMHSFRIEFHGSAGLLTYRTERGDKHFPFCLGRYADTFLPETHYSGKRINTPKDAPYRCLNIAVWTAPDTLLLRTYVIDDYFGSMDARFTFAEDRVILHITKEAEWYLNEYPGYAEGQAQK